MNAKANSNSLRQELELLDRPGSQRIPTSPLTSGTSPLRFTQTTSSHKNIGPLFINSERCRLSADETMVVPVGRGRRCSGEEGSTAIEARRQRVELKLRRLELERIAAEQQAKLLTQKEQLEMQRRIVEKQQRVLQQQKADLVQQLNAGKKAVEEDRKILSLERIRFEQETSALREEISKKATQLEIEQLKQQYEFKRFLEERKQWEQEKIMRHQRQMLELREAREQLYLEEGKISKQIEKNRQALDAKAAEIVRNRVGLQLELRSNERTNAEEIESK